MVLWNQTVLRKVKHHILRSTFPVSFDRYSYRTEESQRAVVIRSAESVVPSNSKGTLCYCLVKDILFAFIDTVIEAL